MTSYYTRQFVALILFILCLNNFSNAGVVISGTRVIYNASKKEVTVNLTNDNTSPVLIQNWIDKGSEQTSPTKIVVPFILTPPINRVDPGKGQTLRITYIGQPALQQDKESVFWLNVLEVPVKNKNTENSSRLNVAFRTRIKLFYRPEGLVGNPNLAPQLLQWKAENSAVKVTNPTPYHVTLATLTYSVNGKKYTTDGSMIAPNESAEYNFKGLENVSNVNYINYEAINDYGALAAFSVQK